MDCLQCFDAVGWAAGRASGLCKKTEWWGTGMVICLERGADLHTAQLMPLPLTVSCFSKIQIGFTFLVPAHQGCAGQRAVKRVCVFSFFPHYLYSVPRTLVTPPLSKPIAGYESLHNGGVDKAVGWTSVRHGLAQPSTTTWRRRKPTRARRP